MTTKPEVGGAVCQKARWVHGVCFYLFILKHLDYLQASVTGKNENNNNPIPSECKKKHFTHTSHQPGRAK